jgi:hypothetical protein
VGGAAVGGGLLDDAVGGGAVAVGAVAAGTGDGLPDAERAGRAICTTAAAAVGTVGAIVGAVDGSTDAAIVVAAATSGTVVAVSPTVTTVVGNAATAPTGRSGPDPSTIMSSTSPDPMLQPTRISARQCANRGANVERCVSFVIKS